MSDVRIPQSAQLKNMTYAECDELCNTLRQELLHIVSFNGGHLASNLGIVELTVALHRVFDFSKDRLVFDVGHQCYVHKMLTGRREGMERLRQKAGISGFPCPNESEADAFIAGHASNSVSVGLGMARACVLDGDDYSVISVIGDGALTGGLAFEGLNDAGASGLPLIVVLNDNQMSINSNVGAISNYLKKIRVQTGYYSFKRKYQKVLNQNKLFKEIYKFNHRFKTKIKMNLFPDSVIFESIGFSYLGPVNGHDIGEIEAALRWAKELKRPVVLHVETKKGKGYSYAEERPGRYHGVGPFDLTSGVASKEDDSFSSVFGKTLCQLADERPEICGITAAMCSGTGMEPFAQKYPERFFDVGIAEGHAVAMAAGLAKQQKLPYIGIYATFLQRAFDMLLHDVSLTNAHIVFGIDRAGLVAGDGPTHQGIYDVGYLSLVPSMTLFAPSNYAEEISMLKQASSLHGPVAVRYPRGKQGAYLDDTSASKTVTVCEGSDISIVTYGILINRALEIAEELKKEQIFCRVIKVNQLLPMPYDALQEELQDSKHVIVLEDAVSVGSLGQKLFSNFAELGLHFESMHRCAVSPQDIISANMDDLEKNCHLDKDSICTVIKEALCGKTKN